MRKVLPIILLVAMLLVSVLAIVPASAAEATQPVKKEVIQPTDEPAAGSIEVSTWEELTNTAHNNKAVHFKNDIVVYASKFYGGTLFKNSWNNGPATIDGRGYTLKVVDDTNGTGNAFSIWHGSGYNHVMKNLKIEGTFISNSNTSHVGIIIRNGGNSLVVDNVVIDATLTAKVVGGGTGMLVGKFDGGKTISFNNVHLYGTYTLTYDLSRGSGDSGYMGVGGFVGSNAGTTTFTNCSSNVDITVNGIFNTGVAGFLGLGGNASFENCTTTGKIVTNGTLNWANIGGFAGYAKNVTTSNCESSREIIINAAIANSNVGGVVGTIENGTPTISSTVVSGAIKQTLAQDSADDCTVGMGGIIGASKGTSTVTIQNSVNRATIYSNTARVGVGGIIGSTKDSTKLIVKNCENYGAIDVNSSAASGSHQGVGGILGIMNGNGQSNASVAIYDSANHAEITAHGTAGLSNRGDSNDYNSMRGGIIGRVYGGVSVIVDGCINTGNITTGQPKQWNSSAGIIANIETYNFSWSNITTANITITDCVNTGNIGNSNYTGGIVGSMIQASSPNVTLTIDGCANYGTISGQTSGGIMGENGVSSSANKLIIKDCYNAGTAKAGIIYKIWQDFDETNANNKDVVNAAYPTPEITGCVNEGEVTAAIVSNYSYSATEKSPAGTKLALTNCVYTSGTVNAEVITETAPADAAAVLAAVKSNICENTLLHDALKLNTYLAATCEDNGHNAHYYCATCDTYWDEDKNETTEAAVVIPNIHSTLTWNAEVPAGCTTTGTKAHYACAECGKNYDAAWAVIDDLTIPTLHSQLTWNDEVPAGCDTTGTKGHYACAECGKNYDAAWAVIDNLTIPTLHSQLTWTDEVAPTCDTEGVKGHYACTTCGKNYDATWAEIDDLTISTLYASIKELEELTADINEAVTKLDVSTLAGKLDELEQAIIDAEANAKTHAEDKDAALKTELLGLIATAKQEAITAAQNALDAAVERLEAADEALANNKADKTALETAINDLNTAIRLAETTAKTYAKDYTDEEIGKLNTTLTQAITDAKNAAIKVANDNLDTARRELNAAKEALEDADEALDNKKADKTALEEAINNLNDAIALAERTAKAYADTQDGILKTDLEGQIADAKTELYGAIDALEAAIRAELEALRSELNNAVDELYELVGDNLEVTADALAAALDKVDALIAETNAALQRADAENKKMLEEALATAELTVTAVIENLMADLENALTDVNTAIENGDTVLESKLEVLSAALENAQAALKIAAAEDKAALLTKIKKADEALTESIKALKKELGETKAALEARDVEIYNALSEKDDSLKTFVIIVCVIASVAFAGCAAFVIYFFTTKAKPVAKKKK